MISIDSDEKQIKPDKYWKWNWFVGRLEIGARKRTRGQLDGSVGKTICCKP